MMKMSLQKRLLELSPTHYNQHVSFRFSIIINNSQHIHYNGKSILFGNQEIHRSYIGKYSHIIRDDDGNIISEYGIPTGNMKKIISKINSEFMLKIDDDLHK